MLNTRALSLAAVAGASLWSASANAASDPTGLWFDHNGRGAVEIAPCGSGNGYCGYVVHVTDAKNTKRCGMQILGNVTDSGGGWIYSPDRGKKYSVELTRLSDDKLQVIGNAGSLFSKTYTWKRAPDDVARCGETNAAAPAKPVEVKKAEVTPEREPVAVERREPAAEKPSKKRALGQGNATSASMALIAAPKRQREDVEVAAAPEAAEPSKPAVAEERAPAAKAEETAAPAKEEASAKVERTEESFEPERKCKFKIPYVGRVISVPCRD
ncbi:DUF2147 domain-containing protein [Hyphomicrobium sp.]|uniref:DUF2147 domain-containing protein n=1 Tax=Hyphomicrobium sp. TaxID=82 RepID=UPI003F704111